jgi:hypothetical protein
MKFTSVKWSALPVAVLILGSVAMAQDQSSSGTQQPAPAQSGTPATTPAPATTPKPTIAQRKENQQDRIANGVKSGQLKADRAANGGKLTAAEKTQINKQQNGVSKQIYADKHNANTQHYGNNKVDQRRENQQDRIAQGIKSGQMTAGEAAKAENQQKGINQQVKADRAANGGKLTTGEKAQVNKEQNAASKNIYHKKHNAKTQPQAQPKSK